LIIIIDRRGQMCNRMWAVAPFIALTKEYGRKIWVLNLEEYIKYYDTGISFDKTVRFSLFQNRPLNNFAYRWLLKLRDATKNSKYAKLLNFLGLRYITIHTSEKQINDFFSTGKIVLIDSWLSIKDSHLLLKHNEYLKKLFYPIDEIAQKIKSRMVAFRRTYSKVIGVHIRRGDYDKWKNGVFFFEDEVYIKVLKELEKQLSSHNVLFYICSNEKILLSKYKDIVCFNDHHSQPVEDWFALSQCDYILGPPSTFSMWASFHGNVPIHFLHQKDSAILLESFSPITYQNYHQNGKYIWQDYSPPEMP
jgi:hypothetical protein